jgi:hypothetical protein
MTDDPPAPQPAKSEQKSVPSERDQRVANRALFIQCMADPVKRRIAFDVLDRNCRDAFGQGEEGLDLFVKLAADVRRANIDEATSEFESRFAPKLDQALLKKKLQPRR